MCGHVGIAGNLEYKDEDTMKRLLIFDYFRGKDSTGFAALRKDGEGRIAKIASHPVDLFDMGTFDKALSAYNSSAFIGHNRAATLGVVNGVNAHPFQSGDIIGCHNGTLTKESFKDLKEALQEETGTDSEAIIKCIDRFGIEETVKMLQGAWALVWFDMKKQELYFLRNDERPFWVGYDKSFKKVFWASEWPIMQAALLTGKGDYDLFTTEDNSAYFSTKVNTLYTYDLVSMHEGLYQDRTEFEGKPLKGKEAPKPVTYTGRTSGDPFLIEDTTSTQAGTTTSTTTSPSKRIELEGTVSDPFDGLLDKNEFEIMTKYGCSFCGEEVSFYDEGLKVFLNRRKVLGGCCSGLKENELHVQGSLEKFLQDSTKLASLVVCN